MTGPEHYELAEEALDHAQDPANNTGEEMYYLARAQVHATLALSRKPVEQYPGELEHLRALLSAVKHAAPQDDAEATNPLTEILTDHYSDSRIVDHQLATDGH